MEYVTTQVCSEYFNVKDTLECGQIFRFKPYSKGYLVFSEDKCAYVYNEGENAFVTTLAEDKNYFWRFFDLDRDYSQIVNSALSQNSEILKQACKTGKGIRILNQNPTETLVSFIISQNNNIPRIKNSIEKLCVGAGESKTFLGENYYAFPTINKMSKMPLDFYKEIGLGYRAEYVKSLTNNFVDGFVTENLIKLSTDTLKEELLKIHGVGPKVCDCVLLFGFHRTDSFPVDTWIEKVYKQDFNGKLTDRKKISTWFVDEFSFNAGYFQQYLFYYKRNLS